MPLPYGTILFLCLCVMSCTQVKESDSANVFNIASRELDGDQLAVFERYIMLDESDEALFSEISKMMYYKERLFIFDAHTSSLYIFGMSGELLGKLDRVGQGPGEYVRLRDFEVKDDCIYLYDDRLRKILCYDLLSLEYKKSISTPFFARAMSKLDNGNFMFVLPKDQGHKQIVVTDSLCNIMAEYIDFKEKDLDNTTRFSLFQKTNRGIVYSKLCSNDVYVFSSTDGSLVENYQIRLDGKVYDLDESEGPELISTPLLFENGMILGRLAEDRQLFCFDSSLSQKEKYSVRKVGLPKNKANELYNPVCAVGDAKVASYLLDEKYQKMDRSFVLSREVERYLGDGGFLICLYELK